MGQEEKSVKHKIIIATINCIEKQGIHNVTNRSIAKEAGVNSAAINYYFGSKEKLIDETLNYALSNAMNDTMGIMNFKHENIYINVYALFLFVLLGMLRYPELMKAFFYEPFIGNGSSNGFFKRFCSLLDGFIQRLEPLIPEEGRQSLRLSIAQITASTSFIGLFPEMFKDFLGYDFKDIENVKKYMTHLLKQYARSLYISPDDSEESEKQIEQLVEYYFKNM